MASINVLKINDLIILFSKQKYFNRWIIFFIDLFFSVLSTFLVFATLGNILKINLPIHEFIYISLFAIVCSTISFLSCQTYKGIIRHSTFTETGRIAIASFVKVALMTSALSFFIHSLSFLQIFLGGLLDLFLTFFVLTIFRALLIIMYSMIVKSVASNNEKLLIYREEDAVSNSPAISLWKQSDNYQIEGYIRIGKRSKIRIGGCPVYSVKDQLEFNGLVNRKGIKAILFTDYHAVKAESERLVRYCERKKVRMLMLPTVDWPLE